jgi:hypothetical protein
MSPLVFLAPFWLLFELAQLIASERYLGLKQIELGEDPRTRGTEERTAFLWSASILTYWGWMLLMLYQPVGTPQMLAMLVVSVAGVLARRGCGLKWVLVILTLEGAIRIGMLFSLCAIVWRQL